LLISWSSGKIVVELLFGGNMSDLIYNGDSEAIRLCVNGFKDYSRELAVNRSFSSIHDGCKPVQRRILYSLYDHKVTKATKSAKSVGYVMGIHPHGDGSIYDAMVRMTESNGSMKPSTLKSTGNTGKSTTSDGQAAMRYTSTWLSELALDLFLNDMEGIEWKDTETDEGQEPVALPAKFPMALTANVQGMGVGVANRVPSFNFLDVVNLSREYIKDGLTFNNQIIYPDFPNGGVVVANNVEMARIMSTGRAVIKSRAKIEIQKRDIVVRELPYNKTDIGVVSSIKKLIRSNKEKLTKTGKPNPNYGKFPWVTSEDHVILETGHSTFGIRIRCRKAADVSEVLSALFRRGILQTKFKSNLVFTDGKGIMIKGVYGVIEEWHRFRRKVLTRKFTTLIDSFKTEMVTLEYFLKLVNDASSRDKYLELLTKGEKGSASEFLVELFPDIPQDTATWISNRRAISFRDGGKEARRYDTLSATVDQYQSNLDDLDTYIYNELTRIANTYGKDYPRLTEITFKDYVFTKREEVVEEDTGFAGFIIYKDGRIVKSRTVEGYDPESPEIMTIIKAQANSTLIGFDYVGNLLRVYGNDLPYGSTDLLSYFGVQGLVGNYRLMYMTLMDGSTKRLLYRDGRMSVLDTSEFIGKKNRKRLIRNGVPEDIGDTLLEVFNEEDLDEYLYVADESGKLTLGIVDWKALTVKSRLGRTRAFVGPKDMDISQWGTCNLEQAHNYFPDLDAFMGKLKRVKLADTGFDGSEFTVGRYYTK
jgi:DNA gyrase/topoisomerase IV, subunit A